jgi:hypothetical protein
MTATNDGRWVDGGRDFLLQLDKELKMMKYLRQHKN